MSKRYNNVTPLRPGQGTGSNGGGNELGERLSALEAKFESVATKEDIQKVRVEIQQMKVWILGGVLGGLVVAVSLAIAIVKLFSAI